MTSSYKREIAIFFIAAVLFFWMLGSVPIWSSDEGRFSEIAREMWESKNFVTPTFYHVEFLEKPVFAYFLASLSQGLFGSNNFGARFPSACYALLGIFMTYFFARKFFDKDTAALAAALLTASIGYFLLGRFAIIDMLLTLLLSSSLFFMLTAHLQKKRNLYLLAYVLMGLSFITKGLVGVALPILIFFFYLLWTGNFSELKRMRLGWGIIIVLAVFVPWGIAVSIQEPEFSFQFITQQHLSRYTTGAFGRTRPIWFFLPIFFLLGFPWSVFFPQCVLREVIAPRARQNLPERFLICWIVTVLVFFSIPQSKLPYYILPVTVPLALLAARTLRRTILADKAAASPESSFVMLIFKVIGVIFLLLSFGLLIYVYFLSKDSRALMMKMVVVWSAVLVFAGVLISVHFFKKHRTEKALYAVIFFVAALFLPVIVGMKYLSPYLSTYGEAKTLLSVLKNEDILAVYASPDHFSDLPFHLKTDRQIMMVGSDHGTLKEELLEEEHKDLADAWFPPADRFVRLFNKRETKVFCLMESEKLEDLLKLGLMNPVVVSEGFGKILIVNKS